MTERWQAKLKGLRRVDVPESSWERMLEGPRGDALPRRRQRVLAGVVALALFVAAAAFAWVAFRPQRRTAVGGDVPAVVTIQLNQTAPGGEPSAVLSFDAEQQPGTSIEVSAEADGGLRFRSADVEASFRELPGFVPVPQYADIRLVGDVLDPWVLFVVGYVVDPDAGAVDTRGAFVELGHDTHGDSLWTVDDRWREWLAEQDLGLGRTGILVAGRWPDGRLFGYVFGIDVVSVEIPVPTPEASKTEPSRQDRSAGRESPSAEEEPAQASGVLRVACDKDGARVLTPTVRTQPDGVHVLVANRSGAGVIGVREPARPSTMWSSGSYGLDDELEMLFGAGEFFVGCFDEENPFHRVEPNDPIGPEYDGFSVVDPDGNWVSTTLGCPLDGQGAVVVEPNSSEVAPGEGADDAAARLIPGIRPGDVVEPAGYLASPHQGDLVRVVRDGEVVAWMSAFGRPGSWGLFQGWACRDSGVGAER